MHRLPATYLDCVCTCGLYQCDIVFYVTFSLATVERERYCFLKQHGAYFTFQKAGKYYVIIKTNLSKFRLGGKQKTSSPYELDVCESHNSRNIVDIICDLFWNMQIYVNMSMQNIL